MLNFDIVLGVSAVEQYRSQVQVLTEQVISLQVPSGDHANWLAFLRREFSIHGVRHEWMGNAFVIQTDEHILSLEQALEFIGRVIPSASVMLVG